MRGAIALSLFALGCSSSHGASDAECRSRATRIGLGTTVNICPAIESLEVAPLQAMLGTDVRLHAVASDPDSTDVSFSWTPSFGAVADPKAADTTYRCRQMGIAEVTLRVSDGQCGDEQTVLVVCGPCSDGGAAAAECEGAR
jgi:hypothetical protein